MIHASITALVYLDTFYNDTGALGESDLKSEGGKIHPTFM